MYSIYDKKNNDPVLDKDIGTPLLSKRVVLIFLVQIVEERSETNEKRKKKSDFFF